MLYLEMQRIQSQNKTNVSAFQLEIQIWRFLRVDQWRPLNLILIRAISTGMITAAISTTYCSFAYLVARIITEDGISSSSISPYGK